jgi:hypothetical protein
LIPWNRDYWFEHLPENERSNVKGILGFMDAWHVFDDSALQFQDSWRSLVSNE